MIFTSSFKVKLLLVAALCQVTALLLMAFDPAEHGFGVLTLWIAPPILLVGLYLPVHAFLNFSTERIRKIDWKAIGALMSFSVSFITYLLTLEPTASLWDCSETIAAAYKLQIPHTPGTPLTLLLGRAFSMITFGNVAWVAWSINLMAGFFSSLAVMIIFLIIWHYGRSITDRKHTLFIGSLGGSLCLAFSDSFWFSAVEAETYGPSIFFMMLILWLTIQGTPFKGDKQKDRIYLISYLTGLSYCIHPMCLLILPVCFLVWITGRAKVKLKHFILAFILGIVCVLFISRIIAVHLFEWAFEWDLFLVNSLSMPFYSGALMLTLVLFIACWILYCKYKQTRVPVISFLLILAGFSPYLMLFIRSAKYPPINEFSPDNLAKIKPYMNREGYPTRPLVYGPYFDADIVQINTKAHSYVKGDHSYKKVGNIPRYQYEKSKQTILPRMYSNDPAHIKVYRDWTGLSANETPRFIDNMTFMIKYQIGHMYFRYLLWNFAGRTSDHQHSGWMKPWDGFPNKTFIAYTKSTNQYFMVPFLLGVIGLIFQFRTSRHYFISNLAFFAITGVLLAIYLNGTPNEPRERDYIYVGSYVAFSIWIGLGMMALIPKSKWGKSTWLFLLVPIWMFYQNLDDHDRSNRTLQMDYARSVLASCEKEAILFTGGDNDTFPMWYLQDVEGFRTDVRVKVLSYLNADWYINQLRRSYYDSPAFNLTLSKEGNQYGPYDPIYIQEQTKRPLSWKRFMQAIKENNPVISMNDGTNDFTILPSREIVINSHKGSISLNINGRFLPKNELAILDLIESNDWKRPIYFNITSLNSLKTNLKDYLIQEGHIYRLTPEKNGGQIPIDLERSSKNLLSNMDYNNLHDSSVYFNYEDYIARIINPLRFNINQLINGYLTENMVQDAKKTAAFAYANLYQEHLEPSFANIQLSRIFQILGDENKSNKLIERTANHYYEKVSYLLDLGQQIETTDLLVLQEAVSESENEKAKEEFNQLLLRIENSDK